MCHQPHDDPGRNSRGELCPCRCHPNWEENLMAMQPSSKPMRRLPNGTLIDLIDEAEKLGLGRNAAQLAVVTVMSACERLGVGFKFVAPEEEAITAARQALADSPESEDSDDR
jgi:hypothetical protein